MSRGTISANEAWQKLIDKYDIVNKVNTESSRNLD